ncbi:MAG: PQQ-dependent dehydrogenase, methanol/ethanol family [Sphingomonas fennica]
MRRAALLLACMALLGAAPDGGAGRIDRARLASAEAGGAMWLTTGGDAGKSHYSTLTDISAATASRLGFAWDHDLGTSRGMEATPIVVDGVMYASGVAGRVYALDAATGAERWTFTPEVDMQANRGACCDMVNRGVAVWQGHVYVAALDGMLYALDAGDGHLLWKAATIDDRGRGTSSTGAPEVAGDVVVIGNGGAEYDTRGYVTAFDLATGERRWRFYTVPGGPPSPADSPAMRVAARTWDPDSRWDIGGGGTVWDAMVYDPRLDLLYIGVGNGGPYPRNARSPKGGDNLYLSSIVALRPKTGEVAWHYQQTPGDQWDYTATQPIVLADLTIDGRPVPVLMQAPKNGFFYVIDRRDGRLLSAKPYARTNWASRIDPATGRPDLLPEGDYATGPKIVWPATIGAHNWHPMAWDPVRRLMFFNSIDYGNLMWEMPGRQPHAPKRLNGGAGIIFSGDVPAVLPTLPPPLRDAVAALPAMRDPEGLKGRGALIAFDPLTGEKRWSVPMAGWWDRAGTLATAGGVVMMGTDAGRFNVYTSSTGQLLKSIDVGTTIMAAPMTYRIGGTQYVAVMAGWGGGGWGYPHPGSAQVRYGNANRIIVFKLDGGPTPKPAPAPPLPPIPAPPRQFGTPAMIAEGGALFRANCAICHSNMDGSNAPDLRRMQSHAVFDEIVLGGALKAGGMPAWDDALTPAQAKAIHAYLIDVQATAYADARAPKRKAKSAPTILTAY